MHHFFKACLSWVRTARYGTNATALTAPTSSANDLAVCEAKPDDQHDHGGDLSIPHYVHHGKSDKPGDPYDAEGGFLYCFLANVNHHRIAADLNEMQ